MMWLLCVAFTPLSWAKSTSYSEVLAEINALLKQQDFIRAYQLADQYTFDFGGEPEFDLLAGFAAYGSEKYQEAVFAFERILLNKPSSFTGRYYLALSYQKVDNLHAAILELEKLLQQPITQVQRDKAQAQLSRVNKMLINRKRTWYGTITGAAAYDNNINSGTSKESILLLINDQPFEYLLSDESRATKDISYSINGAAGYQHPLSQYQWLKLDLTATHHNYVDNTRFQRQQIGFNVSYVQELLRGKVSVSGYSRPLWLQQEVEADISNDAELQNGQLSSDLSWETGLYRTENGMSLFYQKNTSRRTSYRAGASYAKLDNAENNDLDQTRFKVSGAFQYKTKLLHTIMAHYQLDSSDVSAFEHNDRSSSGFTYQLTWPLSNKLVSNNFVSIQQHTYQETHPLFNKIRKETLSSASSQLLFNTTDKLQLKLQLTLQERDSNIDLFSYDRMEVSGSWQYRF